MVSPLSVGRIIHQVIQRPGIPTLPPRIKTSVGPWTSGDTNPNAESRAESNPGIEVECVQGPDDADLESSVPGSRAVRCSIRLFPTTLH